MIINILPGWNDLFQIQYGRLKTRLRSLLTLFTTLVITRQESGAVGGRVGGLLCLLLSLSLEGEGLLYHLSWLQWQRAVNVKIFAHTLSHTRQYNSELLVLQYFHLVLIYILSKGAGLYIFECFRTRKHYVDILPLR